MKHNFKILEKKVNCFFVKLFIATHKNGFVDFAQERAILEKRLQVRGFPKIWTDELTFDEISWFLFDLLSQFGPINNVAVSQSKKDSIVYGIVDMQHKEDTKEFVRTKLDENGKMRLDTWNTTTLSFRQFSTDPDCPRGGGAGKPEERPASSQQSVQPPANKDKVLTITQPLITPPTSEQKEASPKKSESGQQSFQCCGAVEAQTRTFYSRDEIMALQEKAQAQQCKLDPQFDVILRGAENIPTTCHHNQSGRRWPSQSEQQSRQQGVWAATAVVRSATAARPRLGEPPASEHGTGFHNKMKLALRMIPTEVWVDVFCYPWITRKKLGKIVDKFGNRYFAEILQYCLHERGRRTLDRLYLDKTNLEILPRTPMPENIKFFELIIIRYFDSQTLEFLRRIGTLFLINDVNLHLCNVGPRENLTKLRTILGYMSPLFNGIHSLAFNQLAIPLIEHNFGPKLAQVKMIALDLYSAPADPETVQAINFTMNWLTTEGRDPSEPRLLKVSTCSENFQQFTMAVRQQFHSAHAPCTFAVGFNCYGNSNQVATFRLENTMSEQLDGQCGEYGGFQIHRHKQVDSTREQLQEWVKGAAEKSSGIQLYGFTTIGLDLIVRPIHANAGARMIMPGKTKRIKPSASKKPKN